MATLRYKETNAAPRVGDDPLLSSGTGHGLEVFSLPPELRNMIYSCFVLEGSDYEFFPQFCLTWRLNVKDVRQAAALQKKRSLLQLMLTCKSVYQEALHFLFKNVAFGFRSMRDLASILASVGKNGQRSIETLRQFTHVKHCFSGSLLRRVPEIQNLASLRNVTIGLEPEPAGWNEVGDGMHPICVLRGIKLTIATGYILGRGQPKGRSVQEIKMFRDRMIAHVAQPRLAVSAIVD